VLTAVQFCHILDFVLLMPLAPMLMRELSISAHQFGLLVSAYTFSAAATGLLAAAYTDRFDRKRMLLGLLVGFGIGTLLCGLAGSYAVLMAGRIVAGAFGGVLAGVVFAIVGDRIPADRRGRAMGVVMGAFSAASVLGLPFGLMLAARTGWELPFQVLAAVTALVIVGAMVALPPIRGHVATRPVRRRAFVDLWHVAREPRHLRAFAVSVAVMFSAFTVVPFLSAYLVHNVGMPERRLDLIYLVGGLSTLVTGPLLFGPMADRFGHARVFMLAVTLATVPTVIVTVLPPSPLPVILLVTTTMMVLGSGRMISLTALITGVVEPARRGTFMTLNSSIQHGAAGAASFAAGVIVGGGQGGPLLGYGRVGAVAVVASIVTLYLARTLRPAPASSPLEETGAPDLAAPLEAPRAPGPPLSPPPRLRPAAAGEDPRGTP
jgi:predicted MFS family arabinose efflux permease